MQLMPFFLHGFVVSAILFLSVCAQGCYYPDGKSADALQPCNATAAVTICCKSSDICLTNGLCFSPGISSVFRRGCTDKTWNSTECPAVCLDNPADALLTPCGVYGIFCCGQDINSRACCAGSVLNQDSCHSTTTTTATLTTTPIETPSIPSNPQSCTKVKNIAISLGAVLGFFLLLFLVNLAFLYWLRTTTRRRSIERREPALPKTGRPVMLTGIR